MSLLMLLCWFFGILSFCLCDLHATVFGLCHLFNVNFTSSQRVSFCCQRFPIRWCAQWAVVLVVVFASTSTICAHIKWCITQYIQPPELSWLPMDVRSIGTNRWVPLFFLFTQKNSMYFSVVALLYICVVFCLMTKLENGQNEQKMRLNSHKNCGLTSFAYCL